MSQTLLPAPKHFDYSFFKLLQEWYSVHQPIRKGTNLQSVKWQNRSVVLETLWRHQPISRKDLADRTYLTPATLTNIVAEFLAAGYVQEIGPGKQGRGRRPTLLTFVADSAFLIGVSLQRAELNIGVFNMALECQHLTIHPSALRPDSSAAQTLIDLIRRSIEESRVAPRRVLGIAISVPGPLSVKAGLNLSPPLFEQWINLRLGTLVSQAFNLPVWMENDSNANALAEHWIGAGREFNNFVYAESHGGVGSGIILDGRLYTGSTGVAGELGHTSIDRNGPRCPCGNCGCVELYSSEPAIIAYVQRMHAEGRETSLTAIAGYRLTRLTLDQIIEAALHNDALAVQAIQEASRALALSLVNAINLIGPEAIIIGYKLHRAGALCLDSVREVIQRQAIPRTIISLNILSSQLPEPVSLTGAACRALSGLLQEPDILLASPVSSTS